MILLLRCLFVFIIIWMLGITGWASSQCGLFDVPASVVKHPWFLATMSDAYWAFFTFALWAMYKQVSILAKVAWFIAILLLGNIAMAAFCLDELFRIPRGGKISDLLTLRRTGPGGLGIALAGFGILVTAGAWLQR